MFENKRNTVKSLLKDNGELAIDMLTGKTHCVPEVVFGAIQGVSLLSDVTCGSELRALYSRVLAAAKSSKLLNALVEKELDLECHSWLLNCTKIEMVEQLIKMTELAGLSLFLTGETKARLDIDLEEAKADVWVSPDYYVSLSNFAEELADNLDLDSGHPVQDLLAEITAAEMLIGPKATPSEARAVVERARTKIAKELDKKKGRSLLDIANSIVSLWGERFRGFAEVLVQADSAPAVAVADEGQHLLARMESPKLAGIPVKSWIRYENGGLSIVAKGASSEMPEKIKQDGVYLDEIDIRYLQDNQQEKTWLLDTSKSGSLIFEWVDGDDLWFELY
jgi:hypothetical protein